MFKATKACARAMTATLSVGLAVACALLVVEGGVRLSNKNALFAPPIFAPDDALGVKLRVAKAVRLRRRTGAARRRA